MTGSIERVRAILRGDTPDRPPLFDLLRNDAVISHFSGEELAIGNAERAVYGAFQHAVDATRPKVRLPQREGTVSTADGREQRLFRWTTWTAHVRYPSSDAWAQAKRVILRADPAEWTYERETSLRGFLDDIEDNERRLGEVFFIPSGPGIGVMGLMSEVGLEAFSYYNADYPDVMDALLEHRAVLATTFVEHLPPAHGIEVAFVGDDIAYNTGPMLSPAWFENHYFDRFRRVVDAYHAKGIKVLFHSDGNLNQLLDGLTGAGIDGLNPIEVLAGMDIGDIHRRHPQLFMAGGIDVSQLLPFGTPAEIRYAVRKAVEDAEGRIMIGSSTELHDRVPLRNFLAMRDAVLELG